MREQQDRLQRHEAVLQEALRRHDEAQQVRLNADRAETKRSRLGTAGAVGRGGSGHESWWWSARAPQAESQVRQALAEAQRQLSDALARLAEGDERSQAAQAVTQQQRLQQAHLAAQAALREAEGALAEAQGAIVAAGACGEGSVAGHDELSSS